MLVFESTVASKLSLCTANQLYTELRRWVIRKAGQTIEIYQLYLLKTYNTKI